MSGDRLEHSLGRCRVGGTTVKSPEPLPQDLGGDAQQSGRKGARGSLATTAGHDGLWGAAVAPSASPQDVTQASGVCANEAREVDPTSEPESVNTEGWQATHGAWKALVATLTVRWCFLHAFVQGRARATTAVAGAFQEVGENIWHASEAPPKRACAQRLRRWKAWAQTARPASALKNPPLALGDQRAQCLRSDDHEQAPRARNMVDRLRKCIDRACLNGHYCHGSFAAVEHRVRAWAVLWNVCPSSPQTVKKYHGQRGPAERLNGKR